MTRTRTHRNPLPATDLDPTVHERVRLGILSTLAASVEMPFTELKGMLGVTDGNLAIHGKVLVERGYLSIEKRTGGGRGRTFYRITPAGRRAFERYVLQIERVVRG